MCLLIVSIPASRMFILRTTTIDVASMTFSVNSLFSLGLLVRVVPNYAQMGRCQPYWSASKPWQAIGLLCSLVTSYLLFPLL